MFIIPGFVNGAETINKSGLCFGDIKKGLESNSIVCISIHMSSSLGPYGSPSETFVR